MPFWRRWGIRERLPPNPTSCETKIVQSECEYALAPIHRKDDCGGVLRGSESAPGFGDNGF